ncbi:MAG: hypothetical protein U0Z26_17125 [Anaerolineales bacterium]
MTLPIDAIIANTYLKQAFYFAVLLIGSSSYYSLFKYSRKILALFITPTESLTEAEQNRLDRLLESGKKFHNFSFVIAGILAALSTLGNFDKFSAPFGEIVFPKLQTSIGLFLLCVVLLVASDRYFLMSYPWVSAEERRPHYDWMVKGLKIERRLFSSFIFNLPMQIAALGTVVILGTDININKVITFSALLFTGFGILYLPRNFYYWFHLIDTREDHRGGSVTLSVYLLYWYRVIRQILYSIYLLLPILLVIPQWQNTAFFTLFIYSVLVFGVFYIIRTICSIKFIYQRIDKLGVRHGFSKTSQHYK